MGAHTHAHIEFRVQGVGFRVCAVHVRIHTSRESARARHVCTLTRTNASKHSQVCTRTHHPTPAYTHTHNHTRTQDEDDDALESAFRGGGGAGMEGGGGDEMEEDDAPAVPGAGSVILHNSAYIGTRVNIIGH